MSEALDWMKWDDFGSLKLELMDVLTGERNGFAKRVMETGCPLTLLRARVRTRHA